MERVVFERLARREETLRITSYNVCYTKLLRFLDNEDALADMLNEDEPAEQDRSNWDYDEGLY